MSDDRMRQGEAPGGMLLSLGSINVDFRAKVDRWPVAGKSAPAQAIVAAGGGRAANVAFMARRLGVASTLLGRVGDDPFAEMALDAVARAGVDVSHVIRASGEGTGAGLVIVGPDGDKTMLFADNANGHWDAGDEAAVEAVVRHAAARCVLVVDLDVPVDVLRTIAAAACARGIAVVLDPSHAERMPRDLYPLCHAVTPDAHEASALTGIAIDSAADAVHAGKTLRDRGVRRAFVKLGEGGCVVVDESEAFRVIAPRVAPVDKTGAGDAFAGALACAMLARRSIHDAARIAVAASTIAVTRDGTQASYPSGDEVDAMLPSIRVEALGGSGSGR